MRISATFLLVCYWLLKNSGKDRMDRFGLDRLPTLLLMRHLKACKIKKSTIIRVPSSILRVLSSLDTATVKKIFNCVYMWVYCVYNVYVSMYACMLCGMLCGFILPIIYKKMYIIYETKIYCVDVSKNLILVYNDHACVCSRLCLFYANLTYPFRIVQHYNRIPYEKKKKKRLNKSDSLLNNSKNGIVFVNCTCGCHACRIVLVEQWSAHKQRPRNRQQGSVEVAPDGQVFHLQGQIQDILCPKKSEQRWRVTSESRWQAERACMHCQCVSSWLSDGKLRFHQDFQFVFEQQRRWVTELCGWVGGCWGGCIENEI